MTRSPTARARERSHGPEADSDTGEDLAYDFDSNEDTNIAWLDSNN